MRKLLVLAAVLSLAGAAGAAPAKKSAAPSSDLLSPGAYTAKIKALVCEGCGMWIEEKLGVVKELTAVRADQLRRTLTFTVVRPLSRAALQKTLDAAARDMGMGADYTLSEVKPLKAK